MKTKSKEKILIIAIGFLLILAVLPVTAYATVPGTINYQGYLADSNGDAIDTDGTPLSITFSLYTVSTGGTAFWSETLSVEVFGGVYNVILGKTDSLLNEDLTPPCYLGVKVGSDPEMTPRQELTSTAYSISADDADTLDGLDSTAFISTETDPTVPASIKDGIAWTEVSSRPAGLDDGDDVGITSESDPTVLASVKDGVSWNELSGIPGGFADGVDNTGITSESDPQVGTISNNYVPKWNGSALVTGSIYDNGNIGIGKTPSYKLDVSGDINSDGVYKISGNTALKSENFNTFLGVTAGYSNSSGNYNTFAGYGAGYNNTTTSYNTFMGTGSGQYNAGYSNTFMGHDSGYFNSSGYQNTFIGKSAGMAYPSGYGTGSNNTCVGSYAGWYNKGIQNTFIGSYAGRSNNSGTYNTYIGYQSGYGNTSGSSNVFLGYQVGYNEYGSNKLYIDNSNTSSPLIWGDFSSNLLNFNGDVGIGIAGTPTHKLEVNSNTSGNSVLYSKYTGSNSDTIAVEGYSRPADYYGIGGQFTGGYKGVVGIVSPTGSSTYYGVRSEVSGGSGTNYGVYSYVSGSGTNWAGWFNGNVYVHGNLSKDSGTFKIDHPLNPGNKYLYHSLVESPDMKNIYDGVAVLDENGEALIELPEWFEALNKDFRYQLTPIGGPGPDLYIAQEISDNRFQIAGGNPGMKVSWQVTGIRQDAYAKAHPISVEEDKSQKERGYYLYPELYGQPKEKGIEFAHRPLDKERVDQ